MILGYVLTAIFFLGGFVLIFKGIEKQKIARQKDDLDLMAQGREFQTFGIALLFIGPLLGLLLGVGQ